MESSNGIYILLIILSVSFAWIAGKSAVKDNKNLWNTPSFYMLLLTFSFIVGTRYMVGVDYPEYQNIIELGKSHYYYENMEYLNRVLVDLINSLNLKFYWWFIFMAFVQIFFILIAVKDNFKQAFPWIVLCFLMLYLEFYLNGVRQGAALSCFICAATFIKERKLYHYLIFIIVGSMFHKSILVWLPMYWIVNREFLKDIKIQYLIFFCSIIFLPILMNKIVNFALPVLSFIGFEDQARSLSDQDGGIIAVGSGLGVALRYLRRITIIAYYNKLKAFIGKELFVPLYNLFFIGIIFDAATMEIVYLNRMVMYCAIFEIFIFAALLYYMTKTKNQLDRMVIFVLFIPNFILYIFLPLATGLLRWYTIWDAPYII